MKYQKPKLTKHAQLRNITFSEKIEVNKKFTPMPSEEVKEMMEHMKIEHNRRLREGYDRTPPKVKDE